MSKTARRLNICLVAEEYPIETGWGGIGTYHYTLAHGLAGIGCNVHVVARAIKKESIKKSGRITIHRITPVRSLSSEVEDTVGYRLAVFSKIQELYCNKLIDIIESPEWKAETFFVKYFMLNIPLVLRMHSTLPVIKKFNSVSKESIEDKFQVFFESWLINSADHVYSSSHALLKEAKKYYSIKRQVPVFRNPANNFDFRPKPKVKRDKIIVLYVGRIEKRKGVDIIFETIPKILDGNKNVYFYFIGRDTNTSQLGKSFKAELLSGINSVYIPNIKFFGYVKYFELAEYYRKADICVFPSWFENYPAVCLEAMACGKAVLGSSSGGMAEIIRNNKTGMLFDPFKKYDFEEKLVKMISSHQLVSRLGDCAKKEIDLKFDRNRTSERILEIYQKVYKDYHLKHKL